jgi:hypothetical protein
MNSRINGEKQREFGLPKSASNIFIMRVHTSRNAYYISVKTFHRLIYSLEIRRIYTENYNFVSYFVFVRKMVSNPETEI